MRRFRRGARPRRTPCGTLREGNEAGADAAGLECRDLREWTPGGRFHCAPAPSACCAGNPEPEAMRGGRRGGPGGGGRRGGLWSEEEIASSGTGSERAHGRERSLSTPLHKYGNVFVRASRCPGAAGGSYERWAGTLLSAGGTFLR